MGGVCRNVTTFVISMDNDIESHELPEIFISVAKHVSVVGTIIEIWIGIWDLFIISIAVVINDGCDS